MDVFNNREIATAIWFLAFIIFMLIYKNIRKSLLNVVKALFKAKILIWLFLMIAYSVGIVIILYLLGLWDISFLKNSIVWLCFSGIVMNFNSVTSIKEESLFKNIIISNIKIVMILEFVANSYTLSLMGELIMIPFVSLIVVLEKFSRSNEEYISVAKIMERLLIIIGILVIIYVVSNIITDYRRFGSLDTLRKIILPPLLTISFLPFIYFMVLFSAYEQLFIRLINIDEEKSRKIKRYAKWKIMKYCLLSLKRTRKASNMNTFNLRHIRTIADVDKMASAYAKNS